MVTEQREATLEWVLAGQASTEQEEVSEEETTEEPAEAVDKAKEGESKELAPDVFEARVKAEADKRSNSYREKREGDTALIRSLQTELKELRSEKGVKGINKLAETILAGDEEEGYEPDKIEARRKALEEIKVSIKDYNEKSSEVAEVAELASSLSGNIDKGIANHYNLFDDTPAVRAKGTVLLITDAVHHINERKAFSRILDEIPILKNGEEVRQEIDSFIERYMELSDDKGRDLLIAQIKQDLRVAPRKKPPESSDSAGGKVILKGPAATNANLAEGLKEERKKFGF